MKQVEIYCPTHFTHKIWGIVPVRMGFQEMLEGYMEHAFGGLTRYSATGKWDGIEETVWVYRAVTNVKEEELNAHLLCIAKMIKEQLNQTCVLYTVTNIEGVFYYGS